MDFDKTFVESFSVVDVNVTDRGKMTQNDTHCVPVVILRLD